MKKIISIKNDKVAVGYEDGRFEEFHISAFNFVPNIGDEVEIYQSFDKIVITKVIRNFYDNKNTTKKDTYFERKDYENKDKIEYVSSISRRKVNKVVYILLALFFGSLGAHKFYAGKIGTGILYFAFSWTFIPSFIAFFEAISAIFVKSDINGDILV